MLSAVPDHEREMSESDAQLSGREWTASLAVPASIVDNAQSQELKTYLIGEIARAAVVFNIDEIVVYDEYANQSFGSALVWSYSL